MRPGNLLPARTGINGLHGGRQTGQGRPSHQKTLPPSGLLQVRLVGAGEPFGIRPQTRVDWFLSSPQRVDVGMIGGEARRHLGTLGNGTVAGDHDIDVPGGLSQPVECRLVGAHLVGLASVEERDQDVGEHVAGEQDATIREEDRGGGVA